jgi:hypothetical protein
MPYYMLCKAAASQWWGVKGQLSHSKDARGVIEERKQLVSPAAARAAHMSTFAHEVCRQPLGLLRSALIMAARRRRTSLQSLQPPHL